MMLFINFAKENCGNPQITTMIINRGNIFFNLAKAIFFLQN